MVRKIAVSILTVPLMFLVQACNNSSNNPTESTNVVLNAPTNLRAYSASATSIGLQWDLSTSESNADFINYALTVKDTTGLTLQTGNVPKGSAQTTVTGLSEGSIYMFVLRAAGTGGTLSSDSTSVQWSPARRYLTDSTGGPPIAVYELASSLGRSGLQFYSAAGGAKTQSLSVHNVDRVLCDVYVDTSAGGLALKNVSLLGYPRNTFFSSVTRDADNLDDPELAPPASSSYSLNTVTFADAAAVHGKIVYAKSITDNKVVRILVLRNSSSGKLVYGTSPDRYLVLQISYQPQAGNPFAKVPE